MEQLIATGVDCMLTNFPNRLEEALGEKVVGGKVVAKRAAEASGNCCTEL